MAWSSLLKGTAVAVISFSLAQCGGSESVTGTDGTTRPNITTQSLPDGTVGVAYSGAFAAIGGDGSYSWLISSGALPAGLSLSTAGEISGTPTAAETASFTAQVTSADRSTTISLSITIGSAEPIITTTSLPDGRISQAYSRSLAAVGGDRSYSWSISSGALPAGLSLSTAGTISGTPAGAETAPFTVQVTSAGLSSTASLSITILSVTAANVASVEITQVLDSVQLGDSVLLTATLKDATGNVLTNRAITWTTSHAVVATLVAADAEATVTARGLGADTISAISEGVTGESVIVVAGPLTCATVIGGEVSGDDDEFLGSLTNQFDPLSVLNPSGRHGSPFSATSMYNPFSDYGSQFLPLSAFNRFSTTPPRLFVNGFFVAFVSKNTSILTPRVDPDALRQCTF